MDTKDILNATQSTKRLIQDEYYYKYIFKKTERIVSVVFYILHSVQTNSKTTPHIEDVQHTARAVHDAILQSLETRSYAAEDIIRSVAHTLVSLESKLNVAQVAGVVSPDVVTVIHNEIDSVLRGLNKYLSSEAEPLTFDTPEQSSTGHTQQRTNTQQKRTVSEQTAASTGAAPQVDRRERIKTILEAKGEATIKDISEIVTDVSEKTIQRELNAMIEDSTVKRQGERRWSRYSLI